MGQKDDWRFRINGRRQIGAAQSIPGVGILFPKIDPMQPTLTGRIREGNLRERQFPPSPTVGQDPVHLVEYSGGCSVQIELAFFGIAATELGGARKGEGIVNAR